MLLGEGGLAIDLDGIIEPIVTSFNLELWGARWHMCSGRRVLQVFIDKPNGVGADDCAKVSRQISRVLDVEQIGSTPYTLEVSSPGIDRALFKPSHYSRVLGQVIRVVLFTKIEGKRSLTAKLDQIKEGVLILQDMQNNEYQVLLNNVKQSYVVPNS